MFKMLLFLWIFLLPAGPFFKGNLAAEIRIGVITESQYVGDREAAWRIKMAGENLGWTVLLDENEGRDIQDQQLDWTICLIANNRCFNPNQTNYLAVFHPFWFLDEDRKFLSFCAKYDGYLLTINDRESLSHGLVEMHKEFHHIQFYPSVYSTPYRKLELNHLLVMIPVWSNRLGDLKFRLLYWLLSQSGLAKFYGVHRNEDLIQNGYMGKIPFDGVSVIEVLQKHGIVLVLHSDIHNEEKIPTSRIFEAAAASAVIICDENAFVKTHFGDSVFYIDTSLSGESMFNQIEAHLNFIRQDPEKALAMAKKAHQIFIDYFTMENQLLSLKALHQIVISKKQK